MKDDSSHARCLSAVTAWLGSIPAILASIGLVVLWFLSGPFFQFSDTWQLLINTPTTVITFWMAFIIQGTQNRDGRAIQTKLDAILKSIESVPNTLMGLEDKPEKEIKQEQTKLRD